MNIKFKLRSINLPPVLADTRTDLLNLKTKTEDPSVSQSAGFLVDDNNNQEPTIKKFDLDGNCCKLFHINCLLLDGNNDDDFDAATLSFCIIGHQQVIFRPLMADYYSLTPRVFSLHSI